jgi:DNA-binding winged helix-turn-helix (wHTH) protein/tetratricopeptide (TPR) repeat protein
LSVLLSQNPFLIADWLVIPRQNQLQKTGEHINIEPKLMEVLVYLCRNAPEVVSATELIDECWPNQYISDNPVHKCIAQLRKALNDNAKKPTYIKTIPKKGYSIICTVSQINSRQQSQTITWQDGAPYLGSKPYQETHKNIFFGRRKAASEIKRLINRIDMDRCHSVLVLGAQKVGKTSVINVEILPFLQNPVKPFNRQLIEPVIYTLKSSAACPAAAFEKFIQSHFEIDSLDDLATCKPINGKFTVIIDQLETLWVSPQDHHTEALLQLFNKLKSSNRFFFVFILNHEFYTRFMQLESFQQLKADGPTYDLIPPNAEEIRAIIKQPVMAAGFGFEFNQQTLESLADVIYADASNISNALPIISQAMSYLCSQLSSDRELTFKAYKDMGGLSGILANKAEHVFSSCTTTQLNAFKQCLPLLIRLPSDGKAHLNTVDLSMIVDPNARAVINKLIAADLISTQTNQGCTSICLVDESLLEQCQTFKSWLLKNKLSLHVQSEIQHHCDVWQKNDKSKEYLLNNRYLLEHAQETNLNHDELSFLHLSKKQQTTFKRIKNTVVVCLLALLFTVTFLWVDHRQINLQLQASQQRAESLNIFMIRDLKQKLQPIGQLELLEMVSSEVIRYYQNVAQSSEFNEVYHVEALNTLTEVYVNQGKLNEAQQLLTKVYSILEKQPNALTNPAVVFQLSQSNYWSGYIHYLQKNWPLTQTFWQAYLDNTQTLSTLEPENTQWLLEQSYALNNLGSLMLKQDRLDDASNFITSSAQIKEQLVKHFPENHQYLADLSDTVSWQASILAKNNQLIEANQLFLHSSDLAKQLVNYEPNNNQWNHRLGLALYRISVSYFDLGRLDSSKQFAENSINIFKGLINTDPENKAWNKTSINIFILLSKINRYQGDLDMAQLYIDEGMSFYKNYSEQSKSLQTIQNQLFNLRTEASLILNALGQYKAAFNLYDSIYQPILNQWNEAVFNSPNMHIETAKRAIIHYELMQPIRAQTDTQELNHIYQSLNKLSQQNNLRAIALQIKVSSMLRKNIAHDFVSFIHESKFKNPDFLTSEEIL